MGLWKVENCHLIRSYLGLFGEIWLWGVIFQKILGCCDEFMNIGMYVEC
jgi:hypothetical protein